MSGAMDGRANSASIFWSFCFDVILKSRGKRTMTLKEAAATVLTLIEAGEYQCGEQVVRFADEQAAATSGTLLYTPEQLASLGKSRVRCLRFA